MARIYLAKVTKNRAAGLIPADDDARDELRKIGDGEIVCCKVIRPRSLPQFRRWWAICQTIGENQEPARDKDSICNEIKILAGHYDVLAIEGAEGYQVRTPKSISFEKLTEDQWEALLPGLEGAGRARFGNEYFEYGNW